jgi:hypothetical protein
VGEPRAGEVGQLEVAAPCIRSLRITVYVLEYLASGLSGAEILADFPDLASDDIHACLAFAADRERPPDVRPGGVKLLFDQNRTSPRGSSLGSPISSPRAEKASCESTSRTATRRS